MEQDFEKNYQDSSLKDDLFGFTWQDLITVLKLYWRWFVLSIVLCLLLAFVYIKRTPPVYSTFTKVLIKDVDQNARRMYGSALADFSQLGLMNNTNGFDNEMEIIASKTLALRSVTNLKLYIRYFSEGVFRDHEIYGGSPVLADMSKEFLDTLASPVVLKIIPIETGYSIKGTALDEEFETEVKTLPAKIQTPSGWVELRPNPENPLLTVPVDVHIYNPERIASAINKIRFIHF